MNFTLRFISYKFLRTPTKGTSFQISRNLYGAPLSAAQSSKQMTHIGPARQDHRNINELEFNATLIKIEGIHFPSISMSISAQTGCRSRSISGFSVLHSSKKKTRESEKFPPNPSRHEKPLCLEKQLQINHIKKLGYKFEDGGGGCGS